MKTCPNFSSRVCACARLGKARISWEIQEIEKYASRLRQFDGFEMPFLNEYGKDNTFIIIFGSGYLNWPEVCGKLLSMTSHRISGSLNTVVALYAFAIVRCPSCH